MTSAASFINELFHEFHPNPPWVIPSLKLTASLHLKMDGWKTSFVLEWPIFRFFFEFQGGQVSTQNLWGSAYNTHAGYGTHGTHGYDAYAGGYEGDSQSYSLETQHFPLRLQWIVGDCWDNFFFPVKWCEMCRAALPEANINCTWKIRAIPKGKYISTINFQGPCLC